MHVYGGKVGRALNVNLNWNIGFYVRKTADVMR